jgi:hypothetical protein
MFHSSEDSDLLGDIPLCTIEDDPEVGFANRFQLSKDPFRSLLD